MSELESRRDRARRRALRQVEVAMNDQPPPQTCGRPGCQYNTPPGVPDWQGVIQLLQIHARTAHPEPAPAAAAPGHGAQADRAAGKLDKRPRPEAEARGHPQHVRT